MKLGVFCVPYSQDYVQGRKSAADIINWNLQLCRWADQHGLDEAYFAEHYTIGPEPSPAPDAMIAAASQITEQITLAAGAHLLPYHNPISLAHRMMWLDHMTGGRYIAGVAPGAYPTDAQLFNTGRENAAMTAEAIEIIEAICYQKPPFRIDGKYWTVDMPEYQESVQGPHLKPLRPRIPMLMTGMQAKSPTLTEAGRRGYMPMSQQVHPNVLLQHWETYSTAAIEAGHAPDRSEWRVVRDIIVADTDEEALAYACEGPMKVLWSDYNIPNFVGLGLGPVVTGGLIPEGELTFEWMMENIFIVGSPRTVIEKLEELNAKVGGLGGVVTPLHDDYSSQPEVYRRGLELLGTKVLPAVRKL